MDLRFSIIQIIAFVIEMCFCLVQMYTHNYVSSIVRSKSVCFPEGDPSCICGNSSRGRLGRGKQTELL